MDGSQFLVFTPDSAYNEGYDFAGWDVENECFWKAGCGYQYATHWKPLRAPSSE
jgi:hypothetical protein